MFARNGLRYQSRDCLFAIRFATMTDIGLNGGNLPRKPHAKSLDPRGRKVKEIGRSAAAALESDVQVNVRLPREVRDLLAKKAGRDRSVQDLIRQVIDDYVARLREQKLHEMYSAGAKDMSDADRSDRELWLSAYSNRP